MNVVPEIKACWRGCIMIIAASLACACDTGPGSSVEAIIAKLVPRLNKDQHAYFTMPPLMTLASARASRAAVTPDTRVRR